MATATLEQELEALPELSHEFEFEGEGELEGLPEGEGEQEQFFGTLARLARSPALRRIASTAARAALQSLGESEMEGEGEFEGELEGEGEGEGEYELNPIRRIYPDAMLEHLAHAATEAENEQEAAEQFLPLIPLVAAKLLPLAAKAIPMAAKALPKIMKVAPKLTRGVSNITRTLFRNRQTRPLVRTVPTIAKRTVNTLARQAAQGRPVTPRQAVRTLAVQTNRMLSNPQQCAHAFRQSRVLDQQAHRIAGTKANRARATCPTCGQPVGRARCNCA